MCAYPERSTTTISIGKSKSTPTTTLVLLLRPFGACPKGVLQWGPRGPPRSQAARGGGLEGVEGKEGVPPQQVFPQKLFCTSFPDRVTEPTGRQHVLKGVEGAGLPLYIFIQFLFPQFCSPKDYSGRKPPGGALGKGFSLLQKDRRGEPHNLSSYSDNGVHHSLS